MGCGKRKGETPELDGRSARASSDKPKSPYRDLEPKVREDPDRMGIISGGGDTGEHRAAGDHMQGTEDLNQAEIVHGDSKEYGAQMGDETEDLNQGMLDGDLDLSWGRSAYIVACHWDWSRSLKPYSVYKVDIDLSDASLCSSAKAKRLRVAGRLGTIEGGKSFTSLRSRHRAWIVGVGGARGDIIIFDTKSPDPAEAVIHGPNLLSAKWCPVLMAVGDRVYALSKSPSWTSDPDFPPWFEVLDLSQAEVIRSGGGQHLEACFWRKLPNPPCIPWKLSPTDYTRLPITMVTSYAVVTPYILVSFNQPWGTYAFDTSSDKWHKVSNNRLPFIGCASRNGNIFLALSENKGPINAYCIHLARSGKDHSLKLSVTVLPTKYKEHEVDAGHCFSSLGNGRFCSLSFSLDSGSVTFHPMHHECYPTKAYVNLRTYQIDPSLLKTPEEALLAVKPVVSISNELERAFKITNVRHGVSSLASTLLSI